MDLNTIITTNKKTIIYQDVKSSDIKQIMSSETNLSICFKILSKYYEEIIIIARADKKIEIFEKAMLENVTIDFVTTTSLRTENISLEKFRDRIVIFDHCFDGMTSTFNNTFINVKGISDYCKKFIGIDNIGEKFLHINYFPTMLNLLDIDVDIEGMDKKELNNLLLNNTYILIDNELTDSINKDYWIDQDYYSKIDNKSIFENLDISPKINKEIQAKNRKYEVYNYKNDKKNSNKLLDKYLYIFFAIFLGFFGVHKVYEGKYKIAMLYFFFSWTYIPMIIGFIEGVRAIGINTVVKGKFYIN